jgi:glycosyltransferase involved in cell wall biosynthesis
VRVGLDATPLLGPRTGVGRYVAGLAGALATLAGPEPEELALIPFTWRGTGDLPAAAPSGPRVRVGRRRAPARLLQAAWSRLPWPPVEWLAGPVDVFHATNFTAPPTSRAATVVTIHDLTYLRYPEMVTDASARYRDLVPRALRRGAVVATPTAAVATEVAEEYGLSPDRLVVTPLGVDDTWRQATPPDPAWLATRGLPERYLLFVGNREPRKNLGTLLAAYRALLASAPRVVGVEPGPAVGEGARRTTAPASAATHGIPPLVLVGPPGWGEALDTAGLPPDAVRTPGYLAEPDLARVVAGAAALVNPSWYEGFGLPALEALACGTPVVASDLPAHREVLGDLAQLFPPDDPGALAAALATTLDDPGADGAARAARRTRAAGFTWENCATATLSAYRRALEERR